MSHIKNLLKKQKQEINAELHEIFISYKSQYRDIGNTALAMLRKIRAFF